MGGGRVPTASSASSSSACYSAPVPSSDLDFSSSFCCSPSSSCSGSDEVQWQTMIDDWTSADGQLLSRLAFLSRAHSHRNTLQKPRTPATSLRQFFPLRPP
ncbi:hypothetical protein BT93_L3787 [Corymbia citriodora subsp. variegata]|uniref:Uncharacterized protein n=1 Tax=Corymbia citriodora subsp. variegata TaxID=360336 RepID=A0A8T0CVA5_CORYI|nr:hypothetical protein BT93_L3787 [Corymbia citriodora subsp. variegata]